MTADPAPLVVLRPGDNVLIALAEDLDQAEAQDMASKLRDSFPGIEFTVITGISGLLVQPPS